MVKLFFILLSISLSLSAQEDTVSIYFENDSYQLSQIELAKIKPDSSWISVKLIGYTDYLGSSGYNLILSEKRAQAVKNSIIGSSELSKEAFRVIPKGEIGVDLTSRIGVPKNRRVDIIISKKISTPKPKEKELDTNSIETLNAKIKGTKIGSNLILDNLSFIGGQHRLVEDSQPTLDSLILILKENPSLRIAIEGHICCEIIYSDGLDQETGMYNLSEARAKYIYDVLITEGIKANRLSYEGFARTKPIFENELTTAQQQANRRVEIKIIDK